MDPNTDPVPKIKADLCGAGSTTVDTLIKKKGDLHLGCSSAKVIFEKRANEKEPFHLVLPNFLENSSEYFYLLAFIN
jgi:hypothetical protein